MTKSKTGRTLTELELAARRKGADARRLPPELRRDIRVKLTAGEWAIIRQLRAQGR